MELTHGSETSAQYILTPGKYPKEHLQGHKAVTFTMTIIITLKTHLVNFSGETIQCYIRKYEKIEMQKVIRLSS
jgi:hypothetical protein